MSLQVQILHMNQQVSFEDGSTTNFLILELPDGSRITAMVADADATKVIAEVQRTKKIFGEEASAPIQPVFAEARAVDDAIVFGDGPSPPVPPSPAPRQFPRAPHVAADEAGNPVGVASRVVAESDFDEDGVPSL